MQNIDVQTICNLSRRNYSQFLRYSRETKGMKDDSPPATESTSCVTITAMTFQMRVYNVSAAISPGSHPGAFVYLLHLYKNLRSPRTKPQLSWQNEQRHKCIHLKLTRILHPCTSLGCSKISSTSLNDAHLVDGYVVKGLRLPQASS